jgi:hypothetical protein
MDSLPADIGELPADIKKIPKDSQVNLTISIDTVTFDIYRTIIARINDEMRRMSNFKQGNTDVLMTKNTENYTEWVKHFKLISSNVVPIQIITAQQGHIVYCARDSSIPLHLNTMTNIMIEIANGISRTANSRNPSENYYDNCPLLCDACMLDYNRVRERTQNNDARIYGYVEDMACSCILNLIHKHTQFFSSDDPAQYTEGLFEICCAVRSEFCSAGRSEFCSAGRSEFCSAGRSEFCSDYSNYNRDTSTDMAKPFNT